MKYYAKINEAQICTEIITRTSAVDLAGYISIPDYNQSYLWRKWDGKSFSSDTFEPTVTNEALQASIKALQDENATLKASLESIESVKNQEITDLQLALADLAVAMIPVETVEGTVA